MHPHWAKRQAYNPGGPCRKCGALGEHDAEACEKRAAAVTALRERIKRPNWGQEHTQHA